MSYKIFIPELNERFPLRDDDVMEMAKYIDESYKSNAAKNFLSYLEKYKDSELEWEWVTPGLWYKAYCAIIKPRIMKRINNNIDRVINET